MRQILQRFARNTQGATVMVVAISLVVIISAVGGAIDFGRAVQLRSNLQDAADVASVGAIAVNSVAYKLGVSMNGNGTLTGGAEQALSIFNSNYRTSPELVGVSPSALVTKSNSVMTAKVSVSANYKSYILGLIGAGEIPIVVNSTSTATVPPYIDFYLLLDNSPSMGVGATTADIATMVANTSDKCAFACHEDDKPGADYYAKAKTLGVTTRIDVVRQATQNLMTTARSTETIANQYRVAIYDFGLSSNSIDAQAPGAYKVSSLTSDLGKSASDAAVIDLMTVPYQNYNSDRATNLVSVLANMGTIIPASGDGVSSANPQKVLFFVSDGTNDGYDCAYSNGSGCRRITPLDTTTCTALKARGVRIAVLYTTYLPLPTNSFYTSWVAKYVSAPSQLASQMQACASDGLYFEVSPSQGISSAMTALFQRVVSVVRINS
ncbi:TadE/TadG family type IV pilus assembly protein [Asticcacaulis solisilvae]|uniref:TadE/TadG family type IV pilus assembly protein n=1 Tax=Asticcacaulis solisilvae TaxID=1217274 RepID=UPI003FD7FAE5